MRLSLVPAPIPFFDASPRQQYLVHTLMLGELRWEMLRGIELALFRTFGAPRISELLARTGKSTDRPEARRAGTEQIIHTMLERGYSSPRGASALEAMNRIHARFDIGNDEHLYVLSTLVFEPIRWAESFGWRALTGEEQDAYFAVWRAIGDRMGIRDIPETRAEFDAWNRAYEARHFTPHPDSARVASAVSEMYVRTFPRVLRPIARYGLRAVLDVPLLRAIGLRPANALARIGARGVLRMRALCVRVARALRGRSRQSGQADGIAAMDASRPVAKPGRPTPIAASGSARR